MNLDGSDGSGPVLVVRAARRWTDAVLGYLLLAAALVSLAVAATVAVLGITDDQPIVGVLGGLAIGLLLFVVLTVTTYGPAGARIARRGLDHGAGLPLAELGPDGVRARYRVPSLRERRTGRPDQPPYDVAVPWTAVTGWRDGRDPRGQAVIVLDVAETAAVVRRAADPATERYIADLTAGTGSPAAVRAPIAGAAQVAAVRDALTTRGVPALS